MINNDFQRCTSGAQFFNHVCLAKNGYHTGNLPPYSSKTSKRSGCVKPDKQQSNTGLGFLLHPLLLL